MSVRHCSLPGTKMSPEVYPCDQCLHRKVRCDRTSPRCNRCSFSDISCTREIVRKRPGRKKGSGAVISRLKTGRESVLSESRAALPTRLEVFTPESNASGQGTSISESTSLHALNNDKYFTKPPRDSGRVSLTPHGSPASSAPGKLSPFYLLQTSKGTLVPTFPFCRLPLATIIGTNSKSERPAAIISNLPHLNQDVNQFFRDLYPIWPIIDQASFREWLDCPDQIDHSQVCLVLAICALSALHIPEADSPHEEPRKKRAQRFIRQCLQLRSNFDYIENATILSVQTSFFLSVAEVELQKVRSSWFLLREAIMLAQDLGYYETLPSELKHCERLSIHRTLYTLSLTETGLTLLRNKPFAIVTFDVPPDERFVDEDPRILVGLRSLSKLFKLLDKQFLDTWMSGSASTAVPETRERIRNTQHTLATLCFDVENLTDIQKADIFIAQQWLRLVFWQLSMRQGLLSGGSEDPPLSYHFPCVVAKSLCLALGEVSIAALHIHGVAIVCVTSILAQRHLY